MPKDSRIQATKEDRVLVGGSPAKMSPKKGVSKEGDQENFPFKCRCKKNPPHEEMMIMCNICHTWYHGKCHGIGEKITKDIDRYRCDDCILIKDHVGDGDKKDMGEADDDDDLKREKLLRSLLSEKEELLVKKNMIIDGLEGEITSLKDEQSKLKFERETATRSVEEGKMASKIAFPKLHNEKNQVIMEKEQMSENMRQQRESLQEKERIVEQLKDQNLAEDQHQRQFTVANEDINEVIIVNDDATPICKNSKVSETQRNDGKQHLQSLPRKRKEEQVKKLN